MTKVYLGLGANLGCKVGNIRSAVFQLSCHSSIQNVVMSSFYKTKPVGDIEQDWFVNVVVSLETTLPAKDLLDLCLSMEKSLERVRDARWGPRTLDVDILFYSNERIKEEHLEVPHPRVNERAFVLVPLLELSPSFAWEGRPLSGALRSLPDQGVELMEQVVVVVGASEKPDRYANMAQQHLMDSGYRVAPVAPRGDTVLGVPILRDLVDCSDPVDTVTLYVGSARVPSLLKSLLRVRPRRVIFNPGTENEEVRQELESSGIETLEACTLVMLRAGQF